MRYLIVLLMFVVFGGVVSAQTATPTLTPVPTSTPTLTPTPDTIIYATVIGDSGPVGTRFEYAANAGDVFVSMLLMLILFSIWGFFFFYIFVLIKYRV